MNTSTANERATSGTNATGQPLKLGDASTVFAIEEPGFSRNLTTAEGVEPAVVRDLSLTRRMRIPRAVHSTSPTEAGWSIGAVVIGAVRRMATLALFLALLGGGYFAVSRSVEAANTAWRATEAAGNSQTTSAGKTIQKKGSELLQTLRNRLP